MGSQTKVGYYPIQGQQLPSVTSIIGLGLGVPDSLLSWAVKQGALAIAKRQKVLHAQGKRITQAEAIKIAQQARLDILREAGDMGTQVHDAIQNFLEGKGLPVWKLPEEKIAHQRFDGFMKWYGKNDFVPILTEKVVYSMEYKFAGRMDCLCRLNGFDYLLDFKTSNFVHPKFGVQLAAYAHCLQEQGYNIDKIAVLHLKPDGAELLEYDETFETFLKVKAVFDWKVAVDKPFWASRKDADELKAELENEAV